MALALVTAAVAAGSTSGLIEGDCAQDSTDGPSPNVCGTITPALSGARAADISADGQSLYVASFTDQAIHFFERDPATGELDSQGFLGCVWDEDMPSPDQCDAETSGLGGVRDVAVAPDGESVYATSLTDDAIVHLDRNTTTGALTPVACVDDNDNATDATQGEDTCAQTADGLNGAFDVAVSPDNKSVYVTSQNDDALVVFNRDTSDTATHGNLTPAGCIDNTAAGPGPGQDACATNVTASSLDGLRGVAVAPDNRSVYVAASTGDVVSTFARDTTTGAITYQGCVQDNDVGLSCTGPTVAEDGLDGVSAVAVSPDNENVYAGSTADDAVVRFHRDTSGTAAHGTLSPGDCVDDSLQGADNCGQGSVALDDVRSLEVSPDGLSVYASVLGDAALTMLDRDPSGGGLSPAGCIADDVSAESCEQTSETMGSPGDVAISANGSWLYAPSQVENTVTTFERDPNPPNTTITGGPTGATTDSTPTFTFASFGLPLQGFECRVDGGPFAPCGGPTPSENETVGPLSLGPHTFEVRAVDSAFNRDPTPAQAAFTVVEDQAPAPPGGGGVADTGAPDTQITEQPKDKSKKKKATFAFASTEPGSTFTCVLDGKQEFKSCTSPLTVKVKKGKHTFSVTATDAAGNVDPSPATDSWKVKKKKRKK